MIKRKELFKDEIPVYQLNLIKLQEELIDYDERLEIFKNEILNLKEKYLILKFKNYKEKN